MTRHLCLYSLFFLFVTHTKAQTIYTADMFVKKDFLIIRSTKNYNEALLSAKKTSLSYSIQLKLRGLEFNKETGLTLSKEVCKNEGWQYPTYYARGRWDDGVYISIEYTDAYSEFSPGYYIVIVASGNGHQPELKNIYKKIKPGNKTAYFKSSTVYIGCMH